jgi:hypothetical protein
MQGRTGECKHSEDKSAQGTFRRVRRGETAKKPKKRWTWLLGVPINRGLEFARKPRA